MYELIVPGMTVKYAGHDAIVIHVFADTANIRFVKAVPEMSRQMDVYISLLTRA